MPEQQFEKAINYLIENIKGSKFSPSEIAYFFDLIIKKMAECRRANEFPRYIINSGHISDIVRILSRGTVASRMAAFSLLMSIGETSRACGILLSIAQISHFKEDFGLLKQGLSAAVPLRSLFRSINNEIFIRDPYTSELFDVNDVENLIETLKMMITEKCSSLKYSELNFVIRLNKPSHQIDQLHIKSIAEMYVKGSDDASGRRSRIDEVRSLLLQINDQDTRTEFAKQLIELLKKEPNEPVIPKWLESEAIRL